MALVAWVTLALWLVSFLFQEETLKDHLSVFYGIQGLSILCAVTIFGSAPILHTAVRPGFIALAYLVVSIVVGALYFESDLVPVWEMSLGYGRWGHTRGAYLVISSCLLSLFAVSSWFASRSPMLPVGRPLFPRVEGQVVTVTLFGVFFAASLAIESPFAPTILPVFPLACILVLFASRARARWPMALLLISVLAAWSAHDRRAALFLFFPVVWLHAATAEPGRRMRSAFGILTLSGFAALCLLAMSILRGYGQLDPVGFFDAALLIPEYLRQPGALGYLGLNSEVAYIFFHLHNATNLVLDDPGLLAWGETIAKVAFVGVPESLLDFKPKSIVELYTGSWAPGFRGLGGSWAVTFVGEGVWNFSYGAFLYIGVVAALVERAYDRLVRLVWGRSFFAVLMFLILYKGWLTFIRGSGWDMFLALSLVAGSVGILLSGIQALVAHVAARKPALRRRRALA